MSFLLLSYGFETHSQSVKNTCGQSTGGYTESISRSRYPDNNDNWLLLFAFRPTCLGIPGGQRGGRRLKGNKRNAFL